MIKLLSLLFLFLSLYGSQTIFDFPKQNDSFESHLRSMFHRSDHLTIITPSLNHSGIKKELLRYVKSANTVTLIVQSLKDDPLYLVQYHNIELHYYHKRPLNGTIIATDKDICYLVLPLSHDALSREKSFGWCTDDPVLLRQNQNLIHSIMNHSTPYLK